MAAREDATTVAHLLPFSAGVPICSDAVGYVELCLVTVVPILLGSGEPDEMEDVRTKTPDTPTALAPPELSAFIQFC